MAFPNLGEGFAGILFIAVDIAPCQIKSGGPVARAAAMKG
jgi:hypothetical protein